jgi:hypothetical protein
MSDRRLNLTNFCHQEWAHLWLHDLETTGSEPEPQCDSFQDWRRLTPAPYTKPFWRLAWMAAEYSLLLKST